MKGPRKYPKIVIEQKKKFGIYTLTCPIKKEPIYIGCSLNLTSRYYSHLSASDRSPLYKYIQDVLYKYVKRKLVTLDVIYWTDDIEEAAKKETELISKYNKTYTLLNAQPNNPYKMKTRISKDVGRITPSEQNRIDELKENDLFKILYITRAAGGWLLVDIEKVKVRKTDKHEPPFKYSTRMYGKRGSLLQIRSGNIYEDYYLIDDFSRCNFGSHRHHKL